jgi:hypothetical protein
MLELLHREFVYLWYYFSVQFDQIFRFWLIGMLVGSATSVFLKNAIHEAVRSLNTKASGVAGIVIASFLGIASPLCMYGTIPLAASFSRSGMRDDWLAAFMMSSILLNPQLILYSAALGMPAFWIRIALSSICGITAGLLIQLFYKDTPFFRFDGFDAPANRDTHPNPAVRYLKNLWRNVKATAPYFLLGIVLSALFQRYVPADFITSLFGTNNQGFGVLMAATIGVPLYACGGGTIPLLQIWLQDGMSLGSAAAFMTTGPATKITNLGAVKIILGWKRFALYLAYSMAFACLAGWVVNAVI